MIVFDLDRCFRRKAIDYNLLSMSDLDEYARIFYDYSTTGGFQHGTETVLIDLNRIRKEFRITMNDSSLPDEMRWFSIYSNGNLKTLECMFHLLNFTYGNKNGIKGWTHIPKDIDLAAIIRSMEFHKSKDGEFYATLKTWHLLASSSDAYLIHV